MARQARVYSIDDLRRFRGNLMIFMERTRAILDESSSAVTRTMGWLQQDRLPHWQNQVKRLRTKHADARGNLLGAKLFKSPVEQLEERRQVDLLDRQLKEAEQKVVAIRQLIRDFDGEARRHLTACNKLANDVDQDLPQAVDYLRNIIDTLDDYSEAFADAEDTDSAPTDEDEEEKPASNDKGKA